MLQVAWLHNTVQTEAEKSNQVSIHPQTDAIDKQDTSVDSFMQNLSPSQNQNLITILSSYLMSSA